ncbi:hypothetical protein T265_03943 [Opisthorchis viverrini]|uniref:CCAAT-binding factor domain-containing protein n=1 Tax=Opisthorchis viverrini TaxID=6198 RepID=A0A074ZQQ1_OPIVI|nr:hypothetical protein T265_03943 [Opisthorchis viverrini]KER29476.1 hypothetical protein T265_03943 [Opisthorchis viverrini]
MVTPIYKTGDRLSPDSNRPISLTSVPCKVMERILKRAILDHLTSSNMISPAHHGFLPNSSRVTNMLRRSPSEFQKAPYWDHSCVYLRQRPASPCLFFADDLKSQSSDANALQMDVDAAKQCSLDWHLPLNDEKCIRMSFGGDSANAFFMHGEKGPENIMRIDAKNDLCIWVSSNLSFSLHHEKSTQKAFAVLRMIRRTFSRITRMDFQILYGAYVRPLLEYANQVVYSGRTKDVTLIERAQRAATRMVAGLKSVDDETRLAMLDLFPLEYRRLRGDLILTYARDSVVLGGPATPFRALFVTETPGPLTAQCSQLNTFIKCSDIVVVGGDMKLQGGRPSAAEALLGGCLELVTRRTGDGNRRLLLCRTDFRNNGNRLTKSSKRQETYAKIDWNESDRTTALKAVCELLKAHPQFNLSDELIMAVLPFLNDKREQICRAIHAFAKKKSYNVRPAIAKALSLVPIKEVEDAEEKTSVGRNRKMMSRRERKKDKLEKKHEKEMAETRATQSREDRKKLVGYPPFKLMRITYSSLINVIYVDSLLLILNRFIAQESTSLRDGLNCVNAALNVMNHPGSTSALETDPTRFYNHLYSLLGRMSGVCSPCDKIRPNTKLDSLSTAYARSSTPAAFAVAQYIHKNTITKPISSVPDSPNCTPDDEYSKGRVVLKDSEEMTDVMLSSLNMLLIRRRRDVSSNRVLAFVKRLAGAALAMSEPSCTGTILVQLIHLLRLFPRCEVLFDSETEVGGAYRPNVDDPEACLPASACLWELVVLERHPSLVVRELAKAALHWGRTIHTYGPTEAAIRRYNFNIGPRDLTLDHLIQLSPADCRLQLATICEEQSAEPVRVTPTTKKRFHQTYVPSDWFKSMLEQSGLSKEYGDVLHSKRPRIEKS